MNPEAADPVVQDRIAASTAVLDRAREIHGELTVLLDDLDRLVHEGLDSQPERGDLHGR